MYSSQALKAPSVLTEAAKRLDQSKLSRRELARRLQTSVPQLYRLIAPTISRRNLAQRVALLHLLDCYVALVVTPKAACSKTALVRSRWRGAPLPLGMGPLPRN